MRESRNTTKPSRRKTRKARGGFGMWWISVLMSPCRDSRLLSFAFYHPRPRHHKPPGHDGRPQVTEPLPWKFAANCLMVVQA